MKYFNTKQIANDFLFCINNYENSTSVVSLRVPPQRNSGVVDTHITIDYKYITFF